MTTARDWALQEGQYGLVHIGDMIAEQPFSAAGLTALDRAQSARRDALMVLKRAGWVPVNRDLSEGRACVVVTSRMVAQQLLIGSDFIYVALETWLRNGSVKPDHDRWFPNDIEDAELQLLALDIAVGRKP